MNILDALANDRVRSQMKAKSKKRAIELIAEALSTASPEIDPKDVSDALVAREKLGSTGIGQGVAIPHCRFPDSKHPTLGLFKLSEPVDFDAIDHQPVDIIVALMVPEESEDAHLRLLSQIAAALSHPGRIQTLRDAATNEALLDAFRVAVETAHAETANNSN